MTRSTTPKSPFVPSGSGREYQSSGRLVSPFLPYPTVHDAGHPFYVSLERPSCTPSVDWVWASWSDHLPKNPVLHYGVNSELPTYSVGPPSSPSLQFPFIESVSVLTHVSYFLLSHPQRDDLESSSDNPEVPVSKTKVTRTYLGSEPIQNFRRVH